MKLKDIIEILRHHGDINDIVKVTFYDDLINIVEMIDTQYGIYLIAAPKCEKSKTIGKLLVSLLTLIENNNDNLKRTVSIAVLCGKDPDIYTQVFPIQGWTYDNKVFTFYTSI